MSLNWKKAAMALKLAKHLLNPDAIPIHTWGVKGMDLLAEVRAMDVEAYEKEFASCKKLS